MGDVVDIGIKPTDSKLSLDEFGPSAWPGWVETRFASGGYNIALVSLSDSRESFLKLHRDKRFDDSDERFACQSHMNECERIVNEIDDKLFAAGHVVRSMGYGATIRFDLESGDAWAFWSDVLGKLGGVAARLDGISLQSDGKPLDPETPCGWCISCRSKPQAGTVGEKARWVYFIRAGERGPIKIGTAGNVRERQGTMQTGCPEPLALVCRVAGGHRLEAMLHREFARDRIRGEWFRPSEDLLAIIAELQGGR